MYPLLLLSDLVPRQLAPTVGQSVLATSGEVAFSPIFINMVSGGGLIMGREFRLGTLIFVADDSTWLKEAPLDVEALPIHGSSHFHTSACGVLLRQPSTPYWSALMSPSHSAGRLCKRSGRSRLQRWVKHAVACQTATPKSRQSSLTNFTAVQSTCRLALQTRFPRAGAVTPQ